MSNVYQDLSKKFSSMIFLIWPIAVIGCILSGYIMWLDIKTTAFAYDQIPTHEVDAEYAGIVVALLLWSSQIVFFYIYLSDTSKIWSRQVALFCAAIDTFSDTWFKMGGEWNFALLPWAVMLAIGVYTVTSELIFVVLFGFVTSTIGDWLSSLSAVLSSIFGGMMKLAGVEDHNGYSHSHSHSNNTGNGVSFGKKMK